MPLSIFDLAPLGVAAAILSMAGPANATDCTGVEAYVCGDQPATLLDGAVGNDARTIEVTAVHGAASAHGDTTTRGCAVGGLAEISSGWLGLIALLSLTASGVTRRDRRGSAGGDAQ